MNLDIYAFTSFGDADGIRQFSLAHRLAHDAEGRALTARFSVPFSTFDAADITATEQWIELMQSGERGKTPPALLSWLQLHADIHNQTYNYLGGTVQAPDLSVVDFSDPQQFYDWMYAHSAMHDFEQQQLGVS